MKRNKTRNPDMTMLATPDEQTTISPSVCSKNGMVCKPKRTSPPAVVEIPAACPHCKQHGQSSQYGTKSEENGTMMLPDGTIHVGVVRRYKTCGVCGKNFVAVSPM